MKADLTNYRQSPRKVRLLADLIKGRSVKEALSQLDFIGKRAALPVKKLIRSAAANASHNQKTDPDSLVIKDIRVDKGIVLKRFMPRARGSAYSIKKRTSRISVVLGEAGTVTKKNKNKASDKK